MRDTRMHTADPVMPDPWESPFGLLRRFTGDIERLFDSSPRLSPESRLIGEGAWIPSIDVFEKEGSLMIRADLPGLTKDEVDVEVTDEAITLTGERKQEVKEEKEGMYRFERAYGSFYRVVRLPEGVKPEQIKATFTNGVLEVSAPLPPAAKKESRSLRVDIQETAGERKVRSAA